MQSCLALFTSKEGCNAAGQSGLPLVQGRMSLGAALTHSAPQALWTCSALVLQNEDAELAQSWPSELVRQDCSTNMSTGAVPILLYAPTHAYISIPVESACLRPDIFNHNEPWAE